VTLGEHEQDRAARFRFEQDRVRFIAAHGILKQLLGTFLKVAPNSVRFRYDEYGKPRLSPEHEATSVKFNISHSGPKGLFAFAIGRELGVDIERIREEFPIEEIAVRFFSPSEVEELRSVPPNVQADAFFNCWTRKEAYIKAIGEGLSCPLNQFDVTLTPEEPAKLLAVRAAGQTLSRWTMRNLDIDEGYKAALVVEGQGWELTRNRWSTN
jgi:4'-phosphopantetheinyl transferase